MILLKTLHPNRWFLYFMAIAFVILLIVYYTAQIYLLEEDARYLEQPVGERRVAPVSQANISVPTTEQE
jgi:hypothetical protein